VSTIAEATAELADIEQLETAIGSTPRLAEREREAQKALTEAMAEIDETKRSWTVAEREEAAELTEALAAVREAIPGFGDVLNRAIFARRRYETARQKCRNLNAPMTNPHIPRLSQTAQAERVAGDNSLYTQLLTLGHLDWSM
jgi:leucyl aminopeptidase (aminopeptidase T)